MMRRQRSFIKNIAELAQLQKGFTFENQEEWVKQHPQEVARMKEILGSMGMLQSVPLLQEPEEATGTTEGTKELP